LSSAVIESGVLASKSCSTRSFIVDESTATAVRAFRIVQEAEDVFEVSPTIAEAKHMNLVLGREVPDLAGCGNLVAAIRPERHADCGAPPNNC